MSNVVKHHPISGAVITTTILAKVINSSRWMSHQLSYIELGKTILENERRRPEQAWKLKKWVYLREMQVSCVRFISKNAFIPFLIGASALYLDRRISRE